MSELDHLRSAIEKLEAHRPALGDAVVDSALIGLRERLSLLEGATEPGPALRAVRGRR